MCSESWKYTQHSQYVQVLEVNLYVRWVVKIYPAQPVRTSRSICAVSPENIPSTASTYKYIYMCGRAWAKMVKFYVPILTIGVTWRPGRTRNGPKVSKRKELTPFCGHRYCLVCWRTVPRRRMWLTKLLLYRGRHKSWMWRGGIVLALTAWLIYLFYMVLSLDYSTCTPNPGRQKKIQLGWSF